MTSAPLSPHLQIHTPVLTMIFSITHRIAGIQMPPGWLSYINLVLGHILRALKAYIKINSSYIQFLTITSSSKQNN